MATYNKRGYKAPKPKDENAGALQPAQRINHRPGDC